MADPGHSMPAATSASIPIMALLSPKKIKVYNLEKYNGDYTKFNKFKMQLDLSFAVNPIIFVEENNKIVYAASFLRGPAADWWVPKINIITGTLIYATFNDFLRALRAAFNDLNAMITFTCDI